MSLLDLFKLDKLYIKVSKNHVEIIDVEKKIKINGEPVNPFSSNRLLIAEFSIAEKFINDLILKLKRDNKIRRNNSILFHPIDFAENGVSEVENRVYLEIAERLNGKMVKIWVGEELTSEQVIRELKKNE